MYGTKYIARRHYWAYFDCTNDKYTGLQALRMKLWRFQMTISTAVFFLNIFTIVPVKFVYLIFYALFNSISVMKMGSFLAIFPGMNSY